MAKGKKARAAGKKKAHDLRAKELDVNQAKAVAGGKVAFHDLNIMTTVSKASATL